jgi:hypothetical protein
MLFVVSTSAEVTPDSRRQIRSHVMQGKNTGKRRNRYRKGLKKTTVQTHVAETCALSVPQQVGTEYSLIRFADDVDSSAINNLLTCEYG